MPDVEKLREILKTKQAEFTRLNPYTRQFILHRILNGESLFGWNKMTLHVAYLLSLKRHRPSTDKEMGDDYNTAKIIVEIQKHNLVSKHIKHP